MKALTAFKAYNKKVLAMLGMGLVLVPLVACAAQTPSPAGNAQAAGNPNVAPASNTVATGNNMSTTERNNMGLASSYAYSDNGRVTGIIVSGQGRATGIPDLATINLGVEATRDTVQAARDDAAAAMGGIIEVLRQQGIADEDIQTSHFRIDTMYDREGRTVTGFRVSNQVTAKVRNLDNVSTVIDEVVAAGGDLTRFHGISFSIADTKPLEVQAREAAVNDLRAKAEQLASLTGVQLGELVSISETGGAQPLDTRFFNESAAFDMAAAAPTPIMAGETEVTISLQAVYAIGAAPSEPAQ